MRKRIIEWLIKKFLPGYHLHLDPRPRKQAQEVRGEVKP